MFCFHIRILGHPVFKEYQLSFCKVGSFHKIFLAGIFEKIPGEFHLEDFPDLYYFKKITGIDPLDEVASPGFVFNQSFGG